MCGLKCCPYKNDDSMQCEWCPNREPSELILVITMSLISSTILKILMTERKR